jgi:hypothetical protein
MAIEPGRHLLALVLGTAVLIHGVPAKAEEGGGAFDFALGLLGLGDDEKPEITYRERAPLVVPPKMELPPPQQAASANNPGWPADPDVARRKRLEAEKKLPRMRTRADELAMNRPLTAKERAEGYRPGSGMGAPIRDMTMNQDHYWNDPKIWKELEEENKDANFGEPQITPGQEPERRYLTDPPVGYRKPSANAPLKASVDTTPRRRVDDKFVGTPREEQ